MPIITTDDGVSAPQQAPGAQGAPAKPKKARKGKGKGSAKRGVFALSALGLAVAIVGYAGWRAVGGHGQQSQPVIADGGQPSGDPAKFAVEISVPVAPAGEAPGAVPEWAGKSAIPWETMHATTKIRIVD